MKEKFYETVKKYMGAHGMAEPGDCIAAGVSGGADSVCMLHLLVRLQKDIPFRLAVVHVNHGMRAEAAEDAAFVKKLCVQWDIPFYLREVDMAGYAVSHRLSLEEAGRVLRYRAFQEVLLEISAGDRSRIAVAHNADDRAETMLFHMFRGSGLKGLSSIRPVRESVIRPLLCVDRGQIETYLAAAGLGWREDATGRMLMPATKSDITYCLMHSRKSVAGQFRIWENWRIFWRRPRIIWPGKRKDFMISVCGRIRKENPVGRAPWERPEKSGICTEK